MDLLSLVLTLRPAAPADVPANLGRAAHALLLRAIGQNRPELAQSLHDDPAAGSGGGSGPKPITASSLIGLRSQDRLRRQADGLRPERTYTLRFTAITPAAAGAVAEACGLKTACGGANGPLSVGACVELDGAALRVEALTPAFGPPSPVVRDDGRGVGGEGHPWSAQTTYERLSAPWLLGRERPERRITLQFASPTTFRSGGKNLPAPLPELVFGSLLEKWNAYAPVALPEEARRFAGECLALSRYELRTRSLPIKEGMKIGFVGRATFTALNPDRYWLSLMNLLADFALYAGVGAGTTMGMGQCRRIADC